MKIIKSYFLFFSEHPIGYNFIGILLNFVYLFVVNCIYQNDGYPKEFLVPKFYHLINVIFFLNIVFVYFVSSKFITRVRNSEFSAFEEHVNGKEWFRCAVFDNDTFVIIDKPLWGKGKVYYVEDHHYSYSNNIFTFTQKLKGRYRNANMFIAVSVELELGSPCDKKEIFQRLYERHIQDEENSKSFSLSLDNYIDYVFKKFNDKLQPELDELVTKYATREVSEPYVLDKATDLVVFPERIFSNVKNIKLCLSNLEFSSCKGMVEDCSL